MTRQRAIWAEIPGDNEDQMIAVLVRTCFDLSVKIKTLLHPFMKRHQREVSLFHEGEAGPLNSVISPDVPADWGWRGGGGGSGEGLIALGFQAGRRSAGVWSVIRQPGFLEQLPAGRCCPWLASSRALVKMQIVILYVPSGRRTDTLFTGPSSGA